MIDFSSTLYVGQFRSQYKSLWDYHVLFLFLKLKQASSNKGAMMN